jgi:hypothetical protein
MYGLANTLQPKWKATFLATEAISRRGMLLLANSLQSYITAAGILKSFFLLMA